MEINIFYPIISKLRFVKVRRDFIQNANVAPRANMIYRNATKYWRNNDASEYVQSASVINTQNRRKKFVKSQCRPSRARVDNLVCAVKILRQLCCTVMLAQKLIMRNDCKVCTILRAICSLALQQWIQEHRAPGPRRYGLSDWQWAPTSQNFRKAIAGPLSD